MKKFCLTYNFSDGTYKGEILNTVSKSKYFESQSDLLVRLVVAMYAKVQKDIDFEFSRSAFGTDLVAEPLEELKLEHITFDQNYTVTFFYGALVIHTEDLSVMYTTFFPLHWYNSDLFTQIREKLNEYIVTYDLRHILDGHKELISLKGQGQKVVTDYLLSRDNNGTDKSEIGGGVAVDKVYVIVRRYIAEDPRVGTTYTIEGIEKGSLRFTLKEANDLLRELKESNKKSNIDYKIVEVENIPTKNQAVQNELRGKVASIELLETATNYVYNNQIVKYKPTGEGAIDKELKEKAKLRIEEPLTAKELLHCKKRGSLVIQTNKILEVYGVMPAMRSILRELSGKGYTIYAYQTDVY